MGGACTPTSTSPRPGPEGREPTNQPTSQPTNQVTSVTLRLRLRLAPPPFKSFWGDGGVRLRLRLKRLSFAKTNGVGGTGTSTSTSPSPWSPLLGGPGPKAGGGVLPTNQPTKLLHLHFDFDFPPPLEVRSVALRLRLPLGHLQRRKNVHNHHRKKIFWRTFLASEKNFPGRWWIQKPYKNQENHIHHRNLSSVDPNFFFCKKSSALEQGGVWFVFPRPNGILTTFGEEDEGVALFWRLEIPSAPPSLPINSSGGFMIGEYHHERKLCMSNHQNIFQKYIPPDRKKQKKTEKSTPAEIWFFFSDLGLVFPRFRCFFLFDPAETRTHVNFKCTNLETFNM